MIEVELTKKEVDFLFPALKKAETAYTEAGEWLALKRLTNLYASLHTQIFTYGQIEGETNE